MTEKQVEYVVAGMPTLRLITCENCGREVGKERMTHSGVLLAVNNFLLLSLSGFCDCGEEVHWTRADMRMRRILERKTPLV